MIPPRDALPQLRLRDRNGIALSAMSATSAIISSVMMSRLQRMCRSNTTLRAARLGVAVIFASVHDNACIEGIPP